MIDRFINSKCKMETKIPQESPVFSIFFLIYISNLFSEIERRVPDIIYLLFMDNFRLLVANNSLLEIKILLERIVETTLFLGTRNAVIYDISKMKAIQFSKARNQKLIQQTADTQRKFGGQIILPNQKAI